MAYIKPDSNKDYAMILGASSGFGESVALELASAGFNIIGVHLDRGTGLTKVEQIKRQIEDKDVDAVYFNVNAASEKKREEVIQGINDHFAQKGTKGKIKMFLHSLAFGSLAPFIHSDPNERLSQKQMDMTLNVMGNSLVYWVRDLFDAHMFTEGSRIYGMTSSGSVQVIPYYGAVSAAKCLMESHIRQLALELAPYGITANSIRAGVTFTPALRKIPGHETMIEHALAHVPFKRLTQPTDVAKFICAQVTSDENWATGNIFNLDGGEIAVAYHTPFKSD